MNLKTKLTALVAGIGLFVQSSVFCMAEEAADAAATAEASAETASTGGWQQWIPIVLYLLVIVAMFYFLIIRPQKKRKKEEENLRNSLVLGAEIVTIGGICGKIVSIKDDVITIQTSIDNTLIEFKNWAIREIKNPVSDDEPAKDEK